MRRAEAMSQGNEKFWKIWEGFMKEASFVPGLKGWQYLGRQRDQRGQRLGGGNAHDVLGN